MNDTTHLGRLLAVFAHPDDETYLCAGLLAAAVDAGQHVTVVTATRGELGFGDPFDWPTARAARVRTWESRAAMAVLGIGDHRWLGYRDGGCDAVEVDRAAARLATIIRDVAPDTVVTFGPDGITGHPDHIAVSRWVSAAIATVERPPRLLHATTDTDQVERFAELHERFNVFVDSRYPRPVAPEQVAVRVRLRGRELDRKLTALAAQATQTAPVIAAFGADAYRDWVAEELFVDARQPVTTTTTTTTTTLQGAAS